MACFPNLPGLEYLMQQARGGRIIFPGCRNCWVTSHADLEVSTTATSPGTTRRVFATRACGTSIGRQDFIDLVSDPTWGIG